MSNVFADDNRKPVLKSALKPADWNPKKAIALLPDSEQKATLGVLIGKADKIARRTAPNGDDVFEGLQGVFEYTPYDRERDIIQAGVLWLPGGIDEILLKPMRDAEEREEKIAVNIGFEIAVVRATNPQGYSWSVKPLMGDDLVKPEDDPLAALRSKASAALPPATVTSAPQIEKKGK